jgi:pilus assembly protein FimV
LPDLDVSDIDLDGVTDDDEAVESPSQALDQYPQLSIDDEDDELNVDFDLDDLDDIDLDDDDDLGDLDDLDDINITSGMTVDEALSELDDNPQDLTLGDIEIDSPDEDLPDQLADEEVAKIKEAQALDDLDDTDFDDMLSALENGTDDPLGLDDDEPLDIDIAGDISPEAEPEQKPELKPPEDFVDIDSLLEDSGDEVDDEVEPYDAADMDVGLGEFDKLKGEAMVDVDAQDDGFAADLDMAKAYLETGDEENAKMALEAILADGPDGVKDEANALMAKIKNG